MATLKPIRTWHPTESLLGRTCARALPVPGPPGHVPSRELPPGPAQARGLTEQEVAAGAPHGGEDRTASGLTEGCGGRLGWAFMQRAWAGAGPSPELSSPLESNRKVPGKQPRARRAPASGTNTALPHTHTPARAAPTPVTAGSWAVWTRRPGTGTQARWSELGGAPTAAMSWVPKPPPPFPSVGLAPLLFRETQVQRRQGPKKNQRRTGGPAGMTRPERETSRFGEVAR